MIEYVRGKNPNSGCTYIVSPQTSSRTSTALRHVKAEIYNHRRVYFHCVEYGCVWYLPVDSVVAPQPSDFALRTDHYIGAPIKKGPRSPINPKIKIILCDTLQHANVNEAGEVYEKKGKNREILASKMKILKSIGCIEMGIEGLEYITICETPCNGSFYIPPPVIDSLHATINKWHIWVPANGYLLIVNRPFKWV